MPYVRNIDQGQCTNWDWYLSYIASKIYNLWPKYGQELNMEPF